MVTHLFGMCSDMDRIVPVCQEHGLTLIEDVSQSTNAALHGQPLGTFGAIGFFSLSTLKAVSTGVGGIIIGRDDKLLDRIQSSLGSLRKMKPADLTWIIKKNIVISTSLQRFIFSLFTFPVVKLLNRIDPGIVRKLQTDNPNIDRIDEMPDQWQWQFSSIQG